jgi:hypothetical protein
MRDRRVRATGSAMRRPYSDHAVNSQIATGLSPTSLESSRDALNVIQFPVPKAGPHADRQSSGERMVRIVWFSRVV